MAHADESTVETAIQARLTSLDSGNYRANNELVLKRFAAYLREHRDITDLEDLDVIDCRRYAQWLRQRANDDSDQLSAASAHEGGPYFTIVRAFLGWCVDDERLDTNPARPNRVKEALPEHHGDHDRQFWSPDAREALLSFVNDRAHDALDESADSRERAFRDRTVVTMLALTGARGAELFADPRDDHRNGLQWGDVDLERGVAVVFGKTREHQPVPLMDRVVESLERYQRVLAPATDEWPVFPTRHRPSLATAAREGLVEQGWSEDEVETTLDEATGMEVLREHDIAPPALSKNGARSLMRRLCESAEIDIDGEYLKPHGGRRGMGVSSTLKTRNSPRSYSATSRSRRPTNRTVSRTSLSGGSGSKKFLMDSFSFSASYSWFSSGFALSMRDDDSKIRCLPATYKIYQSRNYSWREMPTKSTCIDKLTGGCSVSGPPRQLRLQLLDQPAEFAFLLAHFPSRSLVDLRDLSSSASKFAKLLP